MVTKTTVAVLAAGTVGAGVIIDRLMQGSFFWERPPFTVKRGIIYKQSPQKTTIQPQHEPYSIYGLQKPLQSFVRSKYSVVP